MLGKAFLLCMQDLLQDVSELFHGWMFHSFEWFVNEKVEVASKLELVKDLWFSLSEKGLLSEGTALPHHFRAKTVSLFYIITCMMKIPDGHTTSFCSPGNVGNVECQVPARKHFACQCVFDMFSTSSQRMLRWNLWPRYFACGFRRRSTVQLAVKQYLRRPHVVTQATLWSFLELSISSLC